MANYDGSFGTGDITLGTTFRNFRRFNTHFVDGIKEANSLIEDFLSVHTKILDENGIEQYIPLSGTDADGNVVTLSKVGLDADGNKIEVS